MPTSLSWNAWDIFCVTLSACYFDQQYPNRLELPFSMVWRRSVQSDCVFHQMNFRFSSRCRSSCYVFFALFLRICKTSFIFKDLDFGLWCISFEGTANHVTCAFREYHSLDMVAKTR